MLNFSGHGLLPDIYRSMEQPPRDFKQAAATAFPVVSLIVGAVGLVGYLAFGERLAADIIDTAHQWRSNLVVVYIIAGGFALKLMTIIPLVLSCALEPLQEALKMRAGGFLQQAHRRIQAFRLGVVGVVICAMTGAAFLIEPRFHDFVIVLGSFPAILETFVWPSGFAFGVAILSFRQSRRESHAAVSPSVELSGPSTWESAVPGATAGAEAGLACNATTTDGWQAGRACDQGRRSCAEWFRDQVSSPVMIRKTVSSPYLRYLHRIFAKLKPPEMVSSWYLRGFRILYAPKWSFTQDSRVKPYHPQSRQF